jgi:hypothetical protein
MNGISIKPAQCLRCIHLNENGPEGWICTAFPEGVPSDMYDNIYDHKESYKGDNGIRFEPKTINHIEKFEDIL